MVVGQGSVMTGGVLRAHGLAVGLGLRTVHAFVNDLTTTRAPLSHSQHNALNQKRHHDDP